MKNTSKRLSTREIARAYTYDHHECTDYGEMIQLYTDGHLAITSCSNWAGSRSGRRWITAPGYHDVSQDYGVTAEHREVVREAALLGIAVNFAEDVDAAYYTPPGGWRQTNRGRVCR